MHNFLLLLVIRIHGFCLRKGKDKFRSDTLRADDIYIFFVCFNYLFYNGKTKARALLILTSGKIRLVESVKNKLLIVLRYSYSAVFYRNKDLVVLLSSLNLDGGILVAELDSVIHKIVKDLLFEAFRDTARYLDLTDWSGDSYNPAEEMDYSSQRFAVVDLPEGTAPQTQTFDGKTYLTDEAFYNSLLSGGVRWEPLIKD